MILIRGSYNLTSQHRPCVATIGNYDGVHIGHQAVLAGLVAEAHRLSLPTCVIVFEPTPQEYFAGDSVPARLTRFREKWLMLQRSGIDQVLCLRFDRRLAALPAETFIRDILLDGLGVQHLVVGDDFRFGCERKGDFETLQAAGRKYGFEVRSTPTLLAGKARVSSTLVREALAAGDMGQAMQLLGRPYSMSGRVQHGRRLGRALGFPTANLLPGRRVAPLGGIFAVWVYGIAKQPLPGVANIGMQPTVDGKRCLLEVHLLDFEDANTTGLYGRQLEVAFLHKLRDEIRFPGLDALRIQIGRDVDAARAFFRQNGVEQLQAYANQLPVEILEQTCD